MWFRVVVAGVLGAYMSSSQPVFDVLITGGMVVDGTGTPWVRSDIAIAGGRIAAVGLLKGSEARLRIDAAGMVVSPGFIDIHSHADRGALQNPSLENEIRQGVTTLIAGQDGSSPLPLPPAMKKLTELKVSCNFGFFVGQGSVRSSVVGLVNRKATADEISRMKDIVRRAMEDGAFGMSTGLFYVPGNYTPTEEVIELAKVAGESGGIHVSHMRDEAAEVLQSVRETIRIGEEGNLPTQVTHHKIIGTAYWGASSETLKLIESARARGVDVTIDQYPYTASNTGSAALFPQWSLEGGTSSLLERLKAPGQRAKIKAEIVRRIKEDRGGGDPKNVQFNLCSFDASLAGKTLADAARLRGLEPTFENAAEVAMELQAKGGCSTIYHSINEADVERVMRSPYTMIASDGDAPALGEGSPHPRSYGTFPRVLGRYVREKRVLRLEEAVQKMTGLPAARLRLTGRGTLRTGMAADIVIFDPSTVGDRSEFAKPHQYSVGIRDVLVNGVPVLRGGTMTGEKPGEVLFGPGKQTK